MREDITRVTIIYHGVKINPGVEARIFQKNYINTMTADALDPNIARASAVMVLTM